ncbi:type II secretion system F family protein [Nocardioides sp. GY 10127]|uniref:type II secretion system F family protein n=1 Tax=Nocardioides sp. GY 10127 TaxID=2569762 RepID=UPI0010A757BC|nr:type II secretion system F family protein [Nocardioides sp. GY 10127]TIC84129.1 type II secretion system F family protein [Nocardioides sp. GY 10127]
MDGSLLLLLGAGALLLAGTLALGVLAVAGQQRAALGRSLAAVRAFDAAPAAVRAEVEQPFSERVLAPLAGRLVGIGRRLVRADAAERLQRRLDIAGNPEGWDVPRVLGSKVLAMGVLGALTLVWCLAAGQSPLVLLGATAALAGFGWVLPDLLLYNAGLKREETMQRALPDAVDLLTISVEAGLGFDAAMQRVAEKTRGPLAGELTRFLQESQLGLGRTEAIRAMAERTTLADLRSFCLAMVQADELGVPLGKVLRVQSTEMRTRRRQRAEEKAQKVPVKIMIPLVLMILPSLFVIVMGPAVFRIVGIFS